ncbi:MAG TPA: glycosyltransferase family 2 protein [Planktothrix sp.]|jgi:dolichol-phosphate mannosyltransferase
MLDLSVVVAVYNEDPRNLLRLLERLWKVISAENLSYEVIFVNDGSREEACKALRQIADEVDYVKLIELSRNFGQQAAISAGIDHADGRAVINIDSDLQDPPELIPAMVAKWREGYDVVYAQRSTRRDRVSKRFSAYLFYRLLGSVSSVKIPWDTGDYRLIDRKVINELRALPEKTRFLRGLIPWLGFKQIGIPIDRDAREVGESAYTLRKLLSLALDGLLSFSLMPLFAVSVVGAVFVALSVLFGALALFAPNLLQLNMAGLIATVAFFGGVQILCVGCVAAYIAKAAEEIRARPTYIVSERLGLGFARTEEEPQPASSNVAVSSARAVKTGSR